MDRQFDIDTLRRLAHKWKMGTLTPDEQAYLDSWEQSQRDDVLELPKDGDSPGQIKARLYSKLQAEFTRSKRRPSLRRPLRWLTGATILAGMLLLCSIGYYFYSTLSASGGNDVPPGYNQATLTLADGKTISLDSAQSGIIIQDEDIKYTNGNNVLAEKGRGPGASGTYRVERITYNSLSTPKGGQYQIILSDGTKVWLNAASTLKYPSKFTGNSREVFLEGEAYFSVAKSEKRKAKSQEVGGPFVVRSQNQEILVLGTSFNVAAYADEANERTTLIEGKVQVRSQNLPRKTVNVQLLSPAQQAVVKGDSLTVSKVNVESETAWRDGLFIFRNEPLESIMAKVSRWYNIRVVYDYAEAKEIRFSGEVSRLTPISSVLRNLEMTGKVHFNVQAPTGAERRVTITK